MSRLKPGTFAALAVSLLAGACAGSDDGPQIPASLRRDLAVAAESDGGADPSLGLLRRAAAAAPDDSAAQERFALAAEHSHMYAEAEAAMDRAVSIGGAGAARLAIQGRIALKAGDAPAALRAYTRATKADPNRVDALSGLGVAQDLTRDHEAAQRSYRAALELAPADWDVRGNLALSLLMSDRPADAVKVLLGAETDTSAPRRARHDLALALVADGQRARALRVLEADMPPVQAATLADQFVPFSRWLASPAGGQPRTG